MFTLTASYFIASNVWSTSTVNCKKESFPIKCLKENYDFLLKNDEKQFWDLVHSSEKKALKCTSILKTAEYLDLFQFVKGAASIEEYFAEKIEQKLIIVNPKCFLEAYKILSSEGQKRILIDIKAPIFATNDQLSNALEPFKQDPKFAVFFKSYSIDLPIELKHKK